MDEDALIGGRLEPVSIEKVKDDIAGMANIIVDPPGKLIGENLKQEATLANDLFTKVKEEVGEVAKMDLIGEDGLMREKLDAYLYEKARENLEMFLNVIVQTRDGLQEEDKKNIETFGGKIKDDLYIINAFSAEIPCNALKSLILSPRIVKIYNDAEVRAI